VIEIPIIVLHFTLHTVPHSIKISIKYRAFQDDNECLESSFVSYLMLDMHTCIAYDRKQGAKEFRKLD
jgi:hypothetical protein